MLSRSLLRSLSGKNLLSNSLFSGKRITLKNSRFAFFAFLFALGLIGSRGQAQLTVTASANPTNLVWGKTSQISATASGGVAPYSYEFAWYCSGNPPPTIFATSEPISNSFLQCFELTGTVIFVWRVTDSDNPPNTVQSSVAVQVLPPNKIVPLEVGLQGGVMFQGQQVSIMKTLIFEVRHNTEAVGICADACVQSRIWNTPPFDASSTEPWVPTLCNNFSMS